MQEINGEGMGSLWFAYEALDRRYGFNLYKVKRQRRTRAESWGHPRQASGYYILENKINRKIYQQNLQF